MSILDHTIQVHVPDNITDKRLAQIEKRYTELGLSYVIVKIESKYFGQEIRSVQYDELGEVES